MVNDVTVIDWPLVTVPSTCKSPDPMPHVPWIWHVVFAESLIRKWVGVAPEPADAVPLQVPTFALLAALAAAIQSEGNESVASSVPESAAAQFAGAEPL